MRIIYFLLFLAVSHFGIMQIFRLSTYHKYFIWTLPVLVGYGTMAGWLLQTFKLNDFFLWQVLAASIWLIRVGNRQRKLSADMIDESDSDSQTMKVLAKSVSNTMIFYVLSSIIYIASFSIAYLWIFNAKLSL